jgi:hypothetical protein
VYPASRGLVLRHLGRDLEKAVELLCDHHLSGIHLQVKHSKAATRAAPRVMSVRRRKKLQHARV